MNLIKWFLWYGCIYRKPVIWIEWSRGIWKGIVLCGAHNSGTFMWDCCSFSWHLTSENCSIPWIRWYVLVLVLSHDSAINSEWYRPLIWDNILLTEIYFKYKDRHDSPVSTSPPGNCKMIKKLCFKHDSDKLKAKVSESFKWQIKWLRYHHYIVPVRAHPLIHDKTFQPPVRFTWMHLGGSHIYTPQL